MSGAIVKHDAISGAVVRALVPIAAGQPIYNERMLQDFEEPCFFVIETSVTESPDYEPYSWRDHRIEVSYLPKTDALSDRRSMAEWRLMLLEYLSTIHVDAMTIDGERVRLPVYAQNPECRFVDEHITYYASYRIHCVREQPTAEPMGLLQTHSYIKHKENKTCQQVELG